MWSCDITAAIKKTCRTETQIIVNVGEGNFTRYGAFKVGFFFEPTSGWEVKPGSWLPFEEFPWGLHSVPCYWVHSRAGGREGLPHNRQSSVTLKCHSILSEKTELTRKQDRWAFKHSGFSHLMLVWVRSDQSESLEEKEAGLRQGFSCETGGCCWLANSGGWSVVSLIRSGQH